MAEKKKILYIVEAMGGGVFTYIVDTIRLTAADFLEKLETAVAERSAERMTAMQYAEKLIADKEQGITIFDDTELKEKLLKHGYTFYSQTDTEVVIKLVDYYYKKYNLGPIDAIAKTMVRVRGSYALELMFRDYPGEIWVARKDSPMIIGIADGETYVASDVPAILKYTCNVYYIGNLEFAKLTPGEAHFYDLNGDEIEKQTTEIKWDAEAAEKGGFEHFMMKEIHEQPKAVQDTLNSVIKNDVIDLSSVEITEDEIKNFEQIYIVACGSAWHVGMAAQYVLEDMADIPVRVELASEFRYRKIQVLLEANGLAAGKDHQFKGRYDAEKNAVIISLEKDEQSALSPQKCTT